MALLPALVPVLLQALVPPPVLALLQDLDFLPEPRLVVLGLLLAASVRLPAAFASAACRGSSTTRPPPARWQSLPTSCCFSSAVLQAAAYPLPESVPAPHSLAAEAHRNLAAEALHSPAPEALRSLEEAALHTQREEALSAEPLQLVPLQLAPEPPLPPSHRFRISRRSAHCLPTACRTCCRKPPYVLSLLESRSLLPESRFPVLQAVLLSPAFLIPAFLIPDT